MIRATLRRPRAASAAAARSDDAAASSFQGNGRPLGSARSTTGSGSSARSHGLEDGPGTGRFTVAGAASAGAGSAASTGVGTDGAETVGRSLTGRTAGRGSGTGAPGRGAT